MLVHLWFANATKVNLGWGIWTTHFMTTLTNSRINTRLTGICPFRTWNRQEIALLSHCVCNDTWNSITLTLWQNSVFHLCKTTVRILSKQAIVKAFMKDRILPCSAVRKVSCSSVMRARLTARILVSSGILRVSSLELGAPQRLPSDRLLYPCCQFHRGSHWRQSSNKQRRRKKKNTTPVWSTAGDISTAATASTPSRSFWSSTRRLSVREVLTATHVRRCVVVVVVDGDDVWRWKLTRLMWPRFNKSSVKTRRGLWPTCFNGSGYAPPVTLPVKLFPRQRINVIV